MCNNHRLVCGCGKNQANIMFKNHILPPGVVNNLYCPECSKEIAIDGECMVVDNHWVMEFDLHLAGSCLSRANINTESLSPTFIFDEGYATWNGFTPDDLEQKMEERQGIIALATKDMHRYLSEMRRWGCERSQKLREAGWRKAQKC